MGIALNNNEALSANATLSVQLKATDATSGIREFKLSEGESCNGGVWQPWQAENGRQTLNFAVEPGDNIARSVSVLFKDEAGNITDTCYNDGITVDTVPDAEHQHDGDRRW